MAALKDLLEGKPVGMPLHPAFTHLPIALFPISLLLDAASWIVGGSALVHGAFFCLIAGLVTGVLAGVLGMVDFTDIRSDHPAKKTAVAHLVLNVVALGLFAAGAGLRYGHLDADRVSLAPLLVSIAGLAVLSYSGYLGGHLVYSDGIAVGRHRRRSRMPESTLVVRSVNGVAEVADEAALREGETLRVQVDQYVMTIGRCAGRLFAVQEFCTHRCGPLSEGTLEKGAIRCPWHNSRFDLRTGAVTHGPAKVALRTWAVESHGGRIRVNVK